MKDLPLGPNFPGGLLGFKTGSWRIFGPVIDHQRCTDCLLCWVYCPEGCITRADNGLRVEYDYCKGCGICEQECPVDAIRMEKEAGR